MSSTELFEYLDQFVHQRVRISSNLHRPAHFAVLEKVTMPDSDSVWCHDDTGTSWKVCADGLLVEIEPIVGSRDDLDDLDRTALVRVAKAIYGPSNDEMRNRCDCDECRHRHDEGDTAFIEGAKAFYSAQYGDPTVPPTPNQGDEPRHFLKEW